jgi:predicted site-specific integrase-resolvase
METVHLTQKILAKRWGVSEATLERWRCDGNGPAFIKLRSRVIYRLVDIEAYEAAHLSSSTKLHMT